MMRHPPKSPQLRTLYPFTTLFRSNYFLQLAQRHQRARQLLARHGVQEIARSEEHTSELQSPSVISYAVLCLKKNNYRQSSTRDAGTPERYLLDAPVKYV